MGDPQQFTIEIPQAELDELCGRLRRTRWPADPGNPGGRYGARREWMEDLVHHWAEVYDWRAVEAEMNAYENYKVELDGIPVHFLHAPGRGPNPMPLVLTHGWPWTFWDLHKVIGPLSDPAAYGGDPADAFEVIVPSLPGYGLSVPLETTGVDVARIAELWVQLMGVLGHDRFGAQGGDWGAFVTGQLGHAHAEHLIGTYLTLPVIPGMFGKRGVKREQFAADEQWMVSRMDEARRVTEAHVTIHRRDPQTFAYAMADSPTGLGAWLWHRRQLWCDGDALEVFGRDDLCTLSSLYWFNTSFASSIRLYAEQFSKPSALTREPTGDRPKIIESPTGFGIFPKELLFIPRSVAEEHTDLRRWTVFDRGGHFAPAERPDAVVDELRAFFRDLR
jgi:pimeloyl-ACP methyl ester carboxylesterase